MNKTFDNSEEKYLEAVTVYYKSADGILYYDSDFTSTKKVSKKDLVNLFTKGFLVVFDGTNYVRPTTLAVSTNYASVSYTTVGASSIAVDTAFYSDGYVAS